MTSNHHVYVITATIFDIVSTLSVSSHPLYWWYHKNCISVITSAIVNKIISIVYDMTATVWHHNHCFHDIRFPTYHITSRIYDISSPIAVTSQTLCLWIHVTIFNIKHTVLRQYTNIYEITTSIGVSVWSHTLYWWYNTQCMIWDLLYLWKNMHYIWHLTHDLWYLNTLSNTSVYYISYQTEYIWQHIHCISVITPRLSII